MAAKKKTKKAAKKNPVKKAAKKAAKVVKKKTKKREDKVLAGRLRQMKASGKLKKGADTWTVDDIEICSKCGGRGFVNKK